MIPRADEGVVIHGTDADVAVAFIESTALDDCTTISLGTFHGARSMTVWLDAGKVDEHGGQALLWRVLLWLADLEPLPTRYDLRAGLDNEHRFIVESVTGVGVAA